MKKVLCFILAVLLVIPVFRVGAISTSARAAVVINGETGEVLYSHNMNERLPMASTTKIMTALLLCEQNTLEKEIVTTKQMVTVEGSSMGLLEGDTVSYRALLYGMMLASGNDAANTAAICIDGSVEKFVERMNIRAQELGLKNTHFETPSGLDGKEHYTTAYELALLAREAMKNEAFAAAAAAEYETLYYGNPPYRRTIKNHNKLLKIFDGAVGVKTGFTKKSGRCLVSAAKRDGKYVLAVTLDDGNDWLDHKNLLEFGFSTLKSFEISKKNEYILPTIQNGTKDLAVTTPEITITTQDNADIHGVLYLPRFIYLPVKKGEAVGMIECYKNGEIIKAEKIYSDYTMNMKKTSFLRKFGCVFKYMLSFL